MTSQVAAGPGATLAPARRVPRWTGALATLVLLIAALTILHRELGTYHYHDVTRAMFALPRSSFINALLFTALAYSLLPAYDRLALAYVRKPLPLHRVAFSSLISYGLSQTLGFPLVTSTSVRYRFWTAWGLSTSEVAQAVTFVGSMFVVGIVFVSGVVFLLAPVSTMQILGLPVWLIRPGGALLLLFVACCVWLSASRTRPVVLRGWELRIPPPRLLLLQLSVAALDWTVAGAVLYVMLPAGHGIRFLPFLSAFLLAQFAGQLSHVPGGVGIFETLMVVLLGPYVDSASAIGVLIAYRIVYYLIPFTLSLVMLAGYEAARQRVRIASVANAAGSIASRLTTSLLPQALSATTFIAGAVLLVSGATPSVHGRLAALDDVLPLGIIEASHFAGSVAGACLLVLAWGLARRLDSAYGLTVALLAVGIVASLLKGLDYEEAVILSVALAVVAPSRRAFYRKAAITSEPLSPQWILALTAVAGATIWLGFFSFKHVDFSNEMWLRFTTHGDAPRFMRASLGVVTAFAVFGMMRVMRPADAEPELPTEAELERARRIMSTSPQSECNLVFLGDKALLFSTSGNAFLMYGVSGRTWIALGDPVGPEDEAAELAWRFREEADRHGAWPVFYEVGTDRLPLYIDLGLTLVKLGEAAVVELDSFCLEGGKRKGLRRTLKDVAKSGARFSILPASEVRACLADLKRVSDEWIEAKHTREKRFSLGWFDEAYIARFPVAVVRVENRIVAFANVLSSGDGTEVTVDLMRYGRGAPSGVMEFLFIHLLLWGKEQGYHRFNLGMAPLSGLQNRALAPLWSKAGSLLYRHGEHFYNFRGLRKYKEKFDPKWEPRYLASPGGLVLPRVVANTAALISGGLKGVVSR